MLVTSDNTSHFVNHLSLIYSSIPIKSNSISSWHIHIPIKTSQHTKINNYTTKIHSNNLIIILKHTHHTRNESHNQKFLTERVFLSEISSIIPTITNQLNTKIITNPSLPYIVFLSNVLLLFYPLYNFLKLVRTCGTLTNYLNLPSPMIDNIRTLSLICLFLFSFKIHVLYLICKFILLINPCNSKSFENHHNLIKKTFPSPINNESIR